MSCPVCHAPLIPGITSCVHCGASVEDGDDADEFFSQLKDRLAEPTPADTEGAALAAAQRAQWEAEHAVMRAYQRDTTEARALEYAGDLSAACAIYERMLREGCRWPMPYRRLTVIYRKGKQWGEEERVVRAALGHISAGINQWFVVRLAKILGEQRRSV